MQVKELYFLVHGKWTASGCWNAILDPLNGEPFIKVAEIDEKGTQVSIEHYDSYHSVL